MAKKKHKGKKVKTKNGEQIIYSFGALLDNEWYNFDSFSKTRTESMYNSFEKGKEREFKLEEDAGGYEKIVYDLEDSPDKKGQEDFSGRVDSWEYNKAVMLRSISMAYEINATVMGLTKEQAESTKKMTAVINPVIAEIAIAIFDKQGTPKYYLEGDKK